MLGLQRALEEISDPSRQLRHATLVALSGLTPEEVGEFLRVWQDTPEERRLTVVRRLVDMAEDNPELDFRAVFRSALKDPSEDVRELAISGLWEDEDRSLIPDLIRLLEEDPSVRVRASAAQALGRFVELATDGKLLEKDAERVRRALMGALTNAKEAMEVRRRALEALAPLDTPEVERYIERFYRDRRVEVRSSAIYAMGKTCSQRWLPAVLKELRSPSPVIRYEAANACASIGEEEAVPYLVQLLDDPDVQVQLAVINALGEIGGHLARRALRRFLRSDDEAVQEAARDALNRIEALEDPLSFKYYP